MAKSNNAVKATPTAAETAVVTDPFADVPVVSTSDGVDIRDFTDVAGNAPYKYADVHSRAVASRSPMLVNYKYAQAVLIPGTNRKEFKPGSVYGTIQQIVHNAGKSGIPAYALITELRRAQIGNKRSKYCEALPPVGWAEGWLNTAVTKNIAGIHPTKSADHFAPAEAEKDTANG